MGSRTPPRLGVARQCDPRGLSTHFPLARTQGAVRDPGLLEQTIFHGRYIGLVPDVVDGLIAVRRVA